MKKIAGLAVLMISSLITHSQNTIKVRVRSEATKEPLAGASVMISSLKKGSSTDTAGVAILHNLQNGNFEIQIIRESIGHMTFSFITRQ